MDISLERHRDSHLSYLNGYLPAAHYYDSDLSVCFSLDDIASSGRAASYDSFIFMVCFGGQIDGDVDGNHYDIKPNDLIVCRPHKVFTNIKPSSDFDCLVIKISQKMLLSIVPMNERLISGSAQFAKHPVVSISDDDAQRLRTYGQLIKAEAGNNGPRHRREIVATLSVAAIHKMLYLIDKYIGSNGRSQLKQSEMLFGRFLQLLSDSNLRQRTVNYYAQQLCITPKYLSVVCKRASGKTASDWINEFVVKEIKQQLKHSSKSIKEIALGLEFPNLSFFGKYVKAHIGMSPTQYRKKLFE